MCDSAAVWDAQLIEDAKQPFDRLQISAPQNDNDPRESGAAADVFDVECSPRSAEFLLAVPKTTLGI